MPEAVEVTVDPNQLHQVIINLLQNAADSVPEGGRIQIECSVTSAAVNISITDNGSGIPKDAAQHLFEPFWTTKSSGTGLGLAICYRIIEAHGGTLSVESPPAGGCRFIITLPSL